MPAPAFAVELNSSLVRYDARFEIQRAHREIELIKIQLGAGEFDDAAGSRHRQCAFEAQVGIEVAAGSIDRREIQRQETELARGHLQLTAHG